MSNSERTYEEFADDSRSHLVETMLSASSLSLLKNWSDMPKELGKLGSAVLPDLGFGPQHHELTAKEDHKR